MKVELPTTNRIRVSVGAILIAAISLVAAVDICAAPPSKKLYDHSHVKNLNASDMGYISDSQFSYNRKQHKFVGWLFLDNLQAMDKETAAAITPKYSRSVSYLWLGVPYLGDDVLEILTANDYKPLSENTGKLRTLVLNGKKELSESQTRILLKWRGDHLIVSDKVKITTQAETLINDNFRTWDFHKLSESEMAKYRKGRIETLENL
jgi:hypothetical protein